jgi:hypothetical protein
LLLGIVFTLADEPLIKKGLQDDNPIYNIALLALIGKWGDYPIS